MGSHSPWQVKAWVSIEGTLLGTGSLLKGPHSYGVPSTAVSERQWCWAAPVVWALFCCAQTVELMALTTSSRQGITWDSFPWELFTSLSLASAHQLLQDLREMEQRRKGDDGRKQREEVSECSWETERRTPKDFMGDLSSSNSSSCSVSSRYSCVLSF